MQTGSWRVLGLMSGTSCDGLDLCLARFSETATGWTFDIEASQCSGYDAAWRKRLLSAHLLSGRELIQLDQDLGQYFAEAAAGFLADVDAAPMLVSSHGHTIFHEPAVGVSCQIGQAAAIAARLRLPVVSDFRSLDVQLGGQGAPLVPTGDLHLFAEYDACLNLGGIANISISRQGQTRAQDIAACNMVLNYFSRQLGLEYDAGGCIAASGKALPDLLQALNALELYQQQPPPSLGREYFEKHLLPIFQQYDAPAADMMHSWCLHLSQRIARVLGILPEKSRVMVSGGGAYNAFLCDAIRQASRAQIEQASAELIEQKEALIFGFLGLLRYLGRPNVYRMVTGSSHDHIAGTLIEAFK